MKTLYHVCTTSITTLPWANDLPGFLKIGKNSFQIRRRFQPHLIQFKEYNLALVMLWSQITFRSSMPDVMEI